MSAGLFKIHKIHSKDGKCDAQWKNPTLFIICAVSMARCS